MAMRSNGNFLNLLQSIFYCVVSSIHIQPLCLCFAWKVGEGICDSAQGPRCSRRGIATGCATRSSLDTWGWQYLQQCQCRCFQCFLHGQRNRICLFDWCHLCTVSIMVCAQFGLTVVQRDSHNCIVLCFSWFDGANVIILFHFYGNLSCPPKK